MSRCRCPAGSLQGGLRLRTEVRERSPVLRIICNEDSRAREACGKERESDIQMKRKIETNERGIELVSEK